jgi:dipeptidyl aminopeptidase/acylaminoacyl peptidase
VDRVVLLGHSAGGHLALWSASRHLLPATSRWHRSTPLALRGVITLAAVANLTLAAELGLDDDATAALMGGGPDVEPDRYLQADPARLLPSGTRTVLVHGRADENVPVAQSRDYAGRARAAGADVEVLELEGTGHFELIDPLSAAWPTVIEAVRTVLR